MKKKLILYLVCSGRRDRAAKTLSVQRETEGSLDTRPFKKYMSDAVEVLEYILT